MIGTRILQVLRLLLTVCRKRISNRFSMLSYHLNLFFASRRESLRFSCVQQVEPFWKNRLARARTASFKILYKLWDRKRTSIPIHGEWASPHKAKQSKAKWQYATSVRIVLSLADPIFLLRTFRHFHTD